MSGFDRNDSIWTRDLSEGDSHYMRMGRYGLRRANKQRSFIYSLIMSGLFLIVLIVVVGISSSAPDIAKSSRARERISPSSETPLISIDDSTSLIDDSAPAINGMTDFFKSTGIAPYVIVTGGKKSDTVTDDELEREAAEKYNSLFDDEEHLLVLMLDTGGYKYRYAFYSGTKAAGFMDSEAKQILSQCIDHYIFIERDKLRYANDKIAGGKAIGDAFDDAGKRLTGKNGNYTLIAAVGGGAVLIVLIAAVTLKHSHRKGRLTIEKEYLPGEYVPPSVVRQSDTQNAQSGIKYRYGSEAVAGDLPMGTLITPDMLHPKTESVEMESVYIPKGVLLTPNGGNSSGFAKSTLQYRDNKGNYVYQNSGEKTDKSFDSFAKDFNANAGKTAFADEKGSFEQTTAVYRDGKGSSHLLRNEGGTDESFDDWAENYRKTMGQSAFVDEGDIYPQTVPQPEVPQPPKQADSAEEQLKKWNAFYGINTTPEQDEELTSELDMKSKDAEWEKAYSQLDNNE